MKGYPKGFVTALVGALLLMFATGLLLAPTTLALRADVAVPWRLPGAGRIVVAALHAAGGFALMLLIGALWAVHMRSGWRRHQQRISGVMLGSLLMVLAASAVAVYYLGDESLGTAAALIHLGTGLALAGPFGWHWVHGRRASRRTQPAARRPGHKSPHRPSRAAAVAPHAAVTGEPKP